MSYTYMTFDEAQEALEAAGHDWDDPKGCRCAQCCRDIEESRALDD